MVDLLATTVPLTCNLEAEDRAALADFLAYEAESAQPSLDLSAFDDEDESPSDIDA